MAARSGVLSAGSVARSGPAADDAHYFGDAQLLEAFAVRRDSAAFAALVRRHGPMVLGVCRRAVGNREDAEDAFQATFLVLALKAASIRKPQSVSDWLFGVALRTARKARAATVRRRTRLEQVMARIRPKVAAAPADSDLRLTLDEEISRLPAKYRAVILLCYLEGKTKREVAKQLGLPEGTVSTRLTRAREILRRRLTRKGVTLSAGAMVAVLCQEIAPASVPSALSATAAKAAGLLAAGKTAAGLVSANAAALARGVSKAMFIAKMKLAIILTVGLVLVTGATTEVAQHAIASARVNSILDRAIAEQAALASYSTHLDAEVEFMSRPPGMKGTGANVATELFSIEMRVDRARTDVAFENWYLRVGMHEREVQYKSRAISDGQRQLIRQQYLGGNGPHRVNLSLSSRAGDFRLSYPNAPHLYGIVFGDEKPILQILRDSGAATLRPKMENVDGHPCHVVEGKTDRGSYTVWIDPDAGSLMRRAVISKKPGDLYGDKKLRSQGTDFLMTGEEAEIRDVRIEKVGDLFVPMQATMENRASYGGGVEQTRETARRSGFQLNPDFAKLGAFVMDQVAEGTRVDVLDDDGPLKGAKMIWRHGDVVLVGLRDVVPALGPQPAVGEKAPQIEGKDIDGKPLKLSDYRGKVVVLVFWGSWCGPCMAMVPQERSLVKWLKDKPFALLGVNTEGSRDHARAAMVKERMTWPCWFDGYNGPIRQEWNIRGWPTVYVIDANGIIRYRDPQHLDDAVYALLDELE